MIRRDKLSWSSTWYFPPWKHINEQTYNNLRSVEHSLSYQDFCKIDSPSPSGTLEETKESQVLLFHNLTPGCLILPRGWKLLAFREKYWKESLRTRCQCNKVENLTWWRKSENVSIIASTDTLSTFFVLYS